MPSFALALTSVLALSSSFLLPVQAAPSSSSSSSSSAAALDHPHGFHAPPYIASSVANTVRRGYNHIKRNLAGKARGLSIRDAYYGDAYGLKKPSLIMKKRGETEIPTGWSYVGCVTESNDKRLLAGFGYASDSAMSPLTCLTVCQGFGYTLAGMEYGDECYCASALTGNGGVVESDSTCDMACSGDSSVTCGASWSLSLYKYSSSDSAACATVESNLTTAYEEGIYLSTGSDSFDSSLNTDNSSVRVTVSVIASASTISVESTSTGASSSTGAASSTGASSTKASTSTTATTASSASTATATVTVAINSTASSEWYSLGCAVDDSYNSADIMSYTLDNDDTAITIDNCLAACEAKGYTYAGLEYGDQCFCSSTLSSSVKFVSDSQCDMACDGDSSETCGGEYRMDVYQLFGVEEECSTSTSTSGSVATGVANFVVSGTVQATSTTTAAATETTTAIASTTTAAATTTTSAIASSTATHAVYAHHMVGNTYNYAESNWAYDISLAQGADIDGFALNMGSDTWQPDRVTDAYTAAAAAGFKLFMSLDMSSLSCASQSDMESLVSIVTAHSTSSAQATYDGQVLVSTFSGESCYFGLTSVSAGWASFTAAVSSAGVDMFFVPALFSDISTFSSNSWQDGELNWNGGWPTAGTDLTTASDVEYIDALDGKLYMAAISPAFYTHFGAATYNKNWLYRGDDWLYVTRWEQMISMRAEIDLVEILTWNDYGESSYIGPIDGDLPETSTNWVTGFPHEAWLDITSYYATAFKTGSYPTITTDTITMWARPHPYDAVATDDSVGQPANWQDTQDYVWVLVMATAAGTVDVTSGSTTTSFTVTAGVNQLQVASQAGSMSATFTRDGSTVASVDAGDNYTFVESPELYNFNYYVISSSSTQA